MTTLSNHFDRVVCINLDERPDRWEQVQQTMAPLLGDVPLERFSAIKPDLAQERIHNGRAGCLLSHRRVIEAAYRDGLKSVLVIEDDLYFDEQFASHIKPTLTTLSQTPWDLFYLGFTPKAPLLPAGDGLVRSFGGITTHAIAYHQRAMPELLRRLPGENNVLRFLSRHKSVDRYYWQHLAPRMQCYASAPLLAFQCDDFSDIQQSETLSNRQQSCAAYEKQLIKRVTPIRRIRLQLGGACRRLKYQFDGLLRQMRHPIHAKQDA